jgi:hypothetical protein
MKEPECFIDEYGTKRWILDGKLHRLDGPARVWFNGAKEWFIDDKFHRIDGPAVECREYEAWLVDGKLHRLDGPAVEYANGRKQWHIDDKCYHTQQEHAIAAFLWMNEHERT